MNDDESSVTVRIAGDLRRRLEALVDVYGFQNLSELLRKLLAIGVAQLEEGVHPDFSDVSEDDGAEEVHGASPGMSRRTGTQGEGPPVVREPRRRS